MITSLNEVIVPNVCILTYYVNSAPYFRTFRFLHEE